MRLLEREEELDQLGVALELADSSGRIVLIRGEAGIGKTVLAQEFLTRNTPRVKTLWGMCDDLTVARPFGPLWDMALSGFPELKPPLLAGDRNQTLEVLFEALDSRMRPTVMVVDDLQWADSATVDLLAILARRLGARRGLLVLLLRDEGELLNEIVRRLVASLPSADTRQVALKPLSANAVADLAAGGSRTVEELMGLTGGNPFYLTELNRVEDTGLPASVAQSVADRLHRLPQPSRRIVEIVAVVPGRVPIQLLEKMGLARPDDLAATESLLHLGDGWIGFRHELARRSVESATPPARRQHLNRQVLEVLELFDADPSTMLHHARAGGSPTAIARHAPVAARLAASVSGHKEAVASFRILEPHLELLPIEERAQILDEWAWEELYDGRFDTAKMIALKAVELRRRLADPERLAQSLLNVGSVAHILADQGTAAAVSEEASGLVDPLGGSPILARAHAFESWMAVLDVDGDRSLRLADRAIDTATSLGNGSALGHALINKGTSIAMRQYPSGIDLIEQSLELSPREMSEDVIIRAHSSLVTVALENRDLEEAAARLEVGERAASAHELTDLHKFLQVERCRLEFLRGNWHEAHRLARQSEVSSGLGRARLRLVLRLLAARRGLDSAQVGELPVFALDPVHAAHVAAAAAEAAVLGDRPGDIPEHADIALQQAVDGGFAWQSGELALWLWKAGALAAIPAVIAEPYLWMIQGRWLEAGRAWDRIGCPYERAIALSEGHESAALEALALLNELGAVAAARNLRSELKERGIQSLPRGPQAPARNHPAGLTRRQTEVLELLAEGLTNPEIAARLYVSTRTVEGHVSSLLGKLGATDRGEAVRLARDQALVQENQVGPTFIRVAR